MYPKSQALDEARLRVEAELGLKFEDVTQAVFEKLGFNVVFRKSIIHKIDLVLNLGDDGLIIIECKTIKESGYNKFSSVTRQMKSYISSMKKGANGKVYVVSIATPNEPFELNLSLKGFTAAWNSVPQATQ